MQMNRPTNHITAAASNNQISRSSEQPWTTRTIHPQMMLVLKGKQEVSQTCHFTCWKPKLRVMYFLVLFHKPRVSGAAEASELCHNIYKSYHSCASDPSSGLHSLDGKPPPKNMLKRSSGEMSASKSWCCLCLFGCVLSSPYWSYCLRLSVLLKTAYALPIAEKYKQICTQYKGSLLSLTERWWLPLNASVAPGAWFLSGWNFRASFL